jgi:hypothetical protein
MPAYEPREPGIEAARQSGSPKILAQSVAWQLPTVVQNYHGTENVRFRAVASRKEQIAASTN